MLAFLSPLVLPTLKRYNPRGLNTNLWNFKKISMKRILFFSKRNCLHLNEINSVHVSKIIKMNVANKIERSTKSVNDLPHSVGNRLNNYVHQFKEIQHVRYLCGN